LGVVIEDGAHESAEDEKMGRIEGKVAVITGGASGIGEASVRRFCEEGARVVIADIQEDRGKALAEELGQVARFARVDVTQEDEIAAAIALAVQDFGRLDVMYNNAGVVGALGSLLETSADQWRKTIDILLNGVFFGIKQAALVMVPQGSGVILSTASTAGIVGGLGPHAYTAAKHGVVGLTKSAASELSSKHVRVNAIAPGPMATPMIAAVTSRVPSSMDAVQKALKADSPLGVAGQARDIANAALFLASEESGQVTGHTLVVDAGVTTGAGPSGLTETKAETLFEAGRREGA
jgi:NAD(P)-dependent dehydrogenase (short-subunit alcohol dehydrogenase family)